ncbi:MAG: L,D-transpeptidase [Methylacidiphilales bacterium]|nr:L,D-transpeptidase [Candidatus Methylacidiphilales bacterium]
MSLDPARYREVAFLFPFDRGPSTYYRQPAYRQTTREYYQEERQPARSTTRTVVAYNGREAPGTILISTAQRRLYLVQPGGRALMYSIGVGRDGFQWGGTHSVSRKEEWPDWRPPSEMLKRRPDLPRYMAGGEDNPLGARAIYLGSTLYRIHGSNEPETIGQAVSSGCFRMLNADVIDLYDRVRLGAKVMVMR